MRTRGNKLPEFSLHFKMRHSKKEVVVVPSDNKINHKQSELLSNILRPVTNLSKAGQPGGKKGSRTRLELIPAFKLSDFPPQIQDTDPKDNNLNRETDKDSESLSEYDENSEFEVIHPLI